MRTIAHNRILTLHTHTNREEQHPHIVNENRMRKAIPCLSTSSLINTPACLETRHRGWHAASRFANGNSKAGRPNTPTIFSRGCHSPVMACVSESSSSCPSSPRLFLSLSSVSSIIAFADTCFLSMRAWRGLLPYSTFISFFTPAWSRRAPLPHTAAHSVFPALHLAVAYASSTTSPSPRKNKKSANTKRKDSAILTGTAPSSLPTPKPNRPRAKQLSLKRASSPTRTSSLPPPPPQNMGRRSGPRYYAVANGRNNGIYDSWDDCSQQVTGYGGATFKSFSTQAEAEAFIESHRPQRSDGDNTFDNGDSEPEETYYAPPPRARRTYSPPRDDRPRYDACPRTVAPAAVPYAYSAPDTAPTYSREPVHKPAREPAREPVRHHHRHPVQEVYVDGACSGNGQRGAVAGYGGYYGDSDGRNFSLPVPDTEPQTNNRGELRAVIHVMDRELSSGTPLQPLRIHTDSKYVLDGLTKYSKKWVSNGFRLSTNEPVKNQDLWQKAIDLRDEYNTRYSQQERRDKRYTAHNTMNDPSEAVELRHVRGHSKIHGNERADELAVLGAKRHRRH